MTRVETTPSPYESRGAKEYGVLLFPEDLTGNRFTHTVVARSIEFLNMTRYSNFEFASLDGGVQHTDTADLYRKYGGQREFFKKGSWILDLGSGVGRAVSEFARSKKRARIVGLDPVYTDLQPMDINNGEFVAGKAQHLPFPDDTFTGILACESYPRHTSNYQLAEQIMAEITRVSRPGAVMRATMPLMPGEQLTDKKPEGFGLIEKETAIKQLYHKYGWEYYYSRRGLFIARLIGK